MRILPRLAAATTVTLALLPGCGGGEPAAPIPGGKGAPSPATAATSPDLTSKLSGLINEAGDRFRPLEYEYDEDLLKILDQFDDHQKGKAPGPPPRAMPKLDEREEVAHLKETIRRWEAKTGRSLRAEVDKLKAAVAARKPGEGGFHPEFHKQFSAAFDDLIPIEVAEIRERRNQSLHEKARALFDGYREKDPDSVREQEAFLNKPPYNLPTPGPEGGTKS